MSAVERFLEPGETVRFEAHARGWPPLTAGSVALYALLVAVGSGFVLCTGAEFHIRAGSVDVRIPETAVVAALVAVIEVYRMASFRSQFLAVTSERVLVVAGILRSKLRRTVPAGHVKEARLLYEVPTLGLSSGSWPLPGFDALDLESIANALAVPTQPPVAAGFVRRRSRLLAATLAVLVSAGAEIDAVLQQRARASFAARAMKIRAAVGLTLRAFTSRYLATNEHPEAGTGEQNVWHTFDRYTEHEIEVRRLPRWAVVRTRLSYGFALVPEDPVLVVTWEGDPDFARAVLEDLKKELDAAGIEATWPEAPK